MKAIRWVAGISREKTSPPIRAAPTIPIGESASRGAPSKIAFHRPGIFPGRATSDFTPVSALVYIRSTLWPKPRCTTPNAGAKPRKPACTVWPLIGTSLASYFWTWLVPIVGVRVTSCPSRSTTTGTVSPADLRMSAWSCA